MKNYSKILVIIFIFLAARAVEAQTFPANIPVNHPRIWWNQQRRDQAQQWFATHPFTPSTTTNPIFSSSDPIGNALRYVLTGNTGNARVAIEWAINAINLMPSTVTGVACDNCRIYGEQALIAYDWCYNEMTQAERDAFTTKMNGVVSTWNSVAWGNDNPESNYFWGYFRNSLMWGITSYWENTTAATGFINNAMQIKWDQRFAPHATTTAPGGIPAEGVDYGITVEAYPIFSLETMTMYGRDLYEENNYFKRAVFTNIYSALPDLTYDNPTRSTPGKSWFPFGDSGDFLGLPNPILRSYTMDFMKFASTRWNNIKIGQYARRWGNWLGTTTPRWLDAVDPGGVEADFASLPLDYYSTGEVGHAFLRTQWGAQATVVNLQLASPPLIGHEHHDTGNWQLWRNQRWLSRESPGRGQGSGYSYTGYNNTGRAEAEQSVNHNVLLFGGKGHATGDLGRNVGKAQVLRMETNPAYFYSAVDVTPSYLNSEDNVKWGNVNIAHAEREFIFIRALETLFIFDRVESVSGGNTAKTFLAHFQNTPTPDGDQTYLSVNGNQALRLQTLLPAGLSSANYRLVDEQSSKVSETGNPFRLEVETSGSGTQYFMHVAQARNASDPNLTVSLTDNGTSYTVTMSHPTKGGARIIVNKGINTSGGSVGYSASGVPATTSPLRTTVQGISITNDGPLWDGTTSCSYSISPTSVSRPASASTESVSVTAGAGCGWSATSNAAWLTITGGASGTGNGTLNYSIAANTGGARTGTITIAGQPFTVVQAASACVATISPLTVSPGSSASTGSVSLTTGAGCTWTATSNASWLTVTSAGSGTGSSTVNYSVATNTGGARTGVLTIAGQTFTVNQASASNCSVAPSSGAWINSSFTTQNGTFTINFDATPSLSNMDGVVGISNGSQTTYSGFACLVSFDASGMIKARNGGTYIASQPIPYSGAGTYHIREVINVVSRTYSIFVTPPGGTELTIGSDFAFRTEQNTPSLIQLNNWGAATDPSVSTGTLSVCNFTLGAPCSYSISPGTVSPSAAATTGSVTMTAGPGCSWTATESLSWVSITSGASGTGNGTVNYSITENTSAARSGTITIAGQTFTINQAAPVSGNLLDYYVNETEPVVSFTNVTGGTGSAVVVAEGNGGSNCLKFSGLTMWDKTRRVHYATAKNISSVLSSDVLRISVDMTPGTPSTYIVIAFNDRWDVTVNTPVIDNVAGFQTFDISLSSVRAALGNSVNDIYFHAGDGFPSGVTLKVDDIRFIRPAAGNLTSQSVSMEESGLSDRVNVYPNPARNEMKIELKEPVQLPARLRITDGFGKTVIESLLETGTRSRVIDTKALTPGVYILNLTVPQGLIRKKIIVVHD